MAKNFVSLSADQWELLRQVEQAKHLTPSASNVKLLAKLCKPKIWQEQTLILLELVDNGAYCLTEDGQQQLNYKTLYDSRVKALEAEFAKYWALYGDSRYVMTAQVKVIPNKKYAFDFAFLEQGVLVDVQGGTGNNGAHVRVKGYHTDCTKKLLTQALGYTVVWFTPQMLKNDAAAVEYIGLLLEVLERQ